MLVFIVVIGGIPSIHKKVEIINDVLYCDGKSMCDAYLCTSITIKHTLEIG